MNLISSAAGRRAVQAGRSGAGRGDAGLRRVAGRGRHGAVQGHPNLSGVRGHWIRRKAQSKAPPVSGFLARFRGLLQACAALLTNPHLPNLLQGADLPGKGQDRLRAGAQLLLLPRRHGRVPHWGDSVGDRIVQVPVFLLRYRYADPAGRSAGAVRVRLPVPLRVVSGAAAQDSDCRRRSCPPRSSSR